MRTAYLIVCASLLGACAGQPSDLKCSLVPCEMSPPSTFTATQEQAWHDCMKRTREQYPVALGSVAISTTSKEQRDYDACVTEAKAVKP
jgi:hypothetical protein